MAIFLRRAAILGGAVFLSPVSRGRVQRALCATARLPRLRVQTDYVENALVQTVEVFQNCALPLVDPANDGYVGRVSLNGISPLCPGIVVFPFRPRWLLMFGAVGTSGPVLASRAGSPFAGIVRVRRAIHLFLAVHCAVAAPKPCCETPGL